MNKCFKWFLFRLFKISTNISRIFMCRNVACKIISCLNSLSRKIRELREKYAANKIQRFIMKKIIQRLETLEGRIRYYKYINEYLKNQYQLYSQPIYRHPNISHLLYIVLTIYIYLFFE